MGPGCLVRATGTLVTEPARRRRRLGGTARVPTTAGAGEPWVTEWSLAGSSRRDTRGRPQQAEVQLGAGMDKHNKGGWESVTRQRWTGCWRSDRTPRNRQQCRNRRRRGGTRWLMGSCREGEKRRLLQGNVLGLVWFPISNRHQPPVMEPSPRGQAIELVPLHRSGVISLYAAMRV